MTGSTQDCDLEIESKIMVFEGTGRLFDENAKYLFTYSLATRDRVGMYSFECQIDDNQQNNICYWIERCIAEDSEKKKGCK